MKKIYTLLMILFCITHHLLQANPIRLSFNDTTVVRGNTIYFPIQVDSSLTGWNVTAYELEINFSTPIMEFDSVISSGTLTASWGNPIFNISTGKIKISNAGTTNLVGSGVLVYLRMRFPLSSSGSSAALQFNKALLNEGIPPTETRNGIITVINPPSMTITPDTWNMTVGETKQFSADGGTPQYSWLSTNTSVAIINSNGSLTALTSGFTRVIAIDNNNIIDTSGIIEVCALELTIRDTTAFQGRIILLPIYTTDVTGLNITSGQFSVSFDKNIITALGIEQNGTHLENFSSPIVMINAGKISVAFAGSEPILGSGILIYLRIKASAINSGSTYCNFSGVLFNENIRANYLNGYFTTTLLGSLIISPNTATLVISDSLQFSVHGEATPPLNWSVNDTSLAEISNLGKLYAKKGGVTKVSVVDSIGTSGISDNIEIYDMRVYVLNVSAAPGETTDVNIEIGYSNIGFSSFQLNLNFNPIYFSAINVVTVGTLADGWATSYSSTIIGNFSVAAAGSNSINGSGTLIKIRFRVSENAPSGVYSIELKHVLFNEGQPRGLPINGQIVTSVEEQQIIIPSAFILEQNYPNPFNPSTTIIFSIETNAYTSVRVFDLFGREVATLLNEKLNAGRHKFKWDATGLPSGVYFYQLRSGSFMESKKLVLLR
ncbi:MAG: cohesin domain-containing protein [Bacteroidota bacterium]|nr:cohesin domain-containing protein [Bacteroidota bacterium]